MEIPNWRPKFLTLANADILTGFTGPYWNALLLSQEYSGERFPIRNFVQPTALVSWVKDETNKLIQPAFVQGVSTGNSKYSILTEVDRLPTPSAPTANSVGVASGAAVAAKSGRRYLCLVNTSVNWISLGFGSNAAVLYSGVTLAPNGGTYEMTAAAGNLHDLAINAIASAAASNLAIQEA